jgi:hypothetical protein
MSAIVNASHLVVGLFALWFLYFFCWREHRIDAYRQRLFGVRDDLFDFAASGGIKFDDPAYTTLRDLSNGLIRFAHRLTFTRVWSIVLFGNLSRTNRMEAWMVDVKSRPAAVRDKLLEAHEQIGRASRWHVVAWSPLAWICWFIALFVGLLKVRVRTKVVRGPRDISAVLEQEALEQSSLADDDSCLAPV